MAKGVVEALYESLDSEDRQTFKTLLLAPEVSGGWIATLLRTHYDAPINRHQVEHFRRKIHSGGYSLDQEGLQLAESR